MQGIYIALICIGCAIFVALAVLFLWGSNNLIKTTRYTIKSPKVEGDVKIVCLSDLHGKSFKKDNAKLIKRVQKEEPDVVAITGDIIHKYRERDIAVALRLINSLSAFSEVYFVSGNHEMRSTKYRALRKDITAAGATVLDDGAAEYKGITFAGVNCANIRRGKFFGIAEGEGYKVLLAHLPQYIARYAAAGYDLVLCGHAHGGQWRIPFTGIGFYSPGQGLFPKYNSGMHICGDMRQIISRGLGNSQCPIRLFNRPEIVSVRITNAQTQTENKA